MSSKNLSEYDKHGQLMKATYRIKLWKNEDLVSEQTKTFYQADGKKNWISTKLVEFCRKLKYTLDGRHTDSKSCDVVFTEYEVL